MFQISFKGISNRNKGYFKEATRGFQGSFKDVSKSFNGVARKFQEPVGFGYEAVLELVGDIEGVQDQE